MDDDFPCGHSMDTRWFAVDDAGHVAIFDSCENGHVPAVADEAWNLIDELWQHHYPDGGEAPWDEEELATFLGVFFYHYETDGDWTFDPISPYKRTNIPQTPLHIDQLPPALREQVKQSHLEKVDFTLHELVQPLEQYSCVYWYEEDRVAYLCSDGKTVRPIPGMESRFADFCKQFRQENPKMAKKLIFEGPAEGPKKPRRRRRKENDDGK